MSIGTSRAEPWRRPRSTRTNVKRARLGRFTRLTGLVIALAVLLSTLLAAPTHAEAPKARTRPRLP